MYGIRRLGLLLLVPCALALTVGCEAEDPTEGEEQNQTATKWTLTTIAPGPNPFDVTGQDRVAVATAANGTVYAAYDDSSRHLALATRAKGSSEWKNEVVKSDGECGTNASVAVTGDGSVHLVYRDRTAGALMHSIRAAGSNSWTHAVVDPLGSENHLVAGADGTLHLLAIDWDVSTATESLVYGRYQSGNWSLEEVASGGTYAHPVVTLDEAGAPHLIAWAGSGAKLSPGSLILGERGTGGWNTEALDLDASFSSDLLVQGGVTHVVYSTPETKGAFYVSRKADAAWSEPEKVIGFGGYYPDLELDQNGRPQVALSVNGSIYFASRTEAGTWDASQIAKGAGGYISPFFIPGSGREIVFTDWALRQFLSARP